MKSRSQALQITPARSTLASTRACVSLRLTSLLTVRSYFSFGVGVRSPSSLVARAHELGFHSVGLTDESSVAGAVELYRATRERGMRATLGATVPVRFAVKGGRPGDTFALTLIAATRSGYQHLNELLTLLQEGRQDALTPTQLQEHALDVFCLTGGRDGFPTQLFAKRRHPEVLDHLRTLKSAFRDRLFVQVFHERAPGDSRRRDYLRALARDQGLPLVAAPDARLTEKTDFPLLDALTCARLGIDVTTPHALRPRNDGTLLLTPEQYGKLIPFPDALQNATRIQRECALELLPERLTPPGCHVPHGLNAHEYLESVAYTALPRRYPPRLWQQAEQRLSHELDIVQSLELASFFLTAYEIAQFCQRQGILAAGRGSAAASVLCYLLGITQIDPVKHDLLFERFLFTGKTAMPDVDFDISSARRREVIEWVEERWGASAEAMVSARVTYRLPSAVQDLGRALGMPPEQRDRLSRALGRDYRHLRPHRARQAEVVFDEVLGNAPVKHQLLDLLERMEAKFVRQLNPHSGGVVISDATLTRYSPIDRSSGGIKMLAFDKDDVESLGLIKLDLLGLRMLSALERAREDVLRLEGWWLDFADLPDDPDVWEDISIGDTMGLFQIESPGQVRLSTQLKPRTMTQLAHQVALFRPGPIQSQTVHPYIRRARGQERVPPLPAPLDEILTPTHGVILFQEQVLRILVRVCGLDWGPAEKFRKSLANCEDDTEEQKLQGEFVRLAVRHTGWTSEQALSCFRSCAVFKGYGFAESHAWAFAQHSYASAWLRRHYPAVFWAAVLAEAPGMWPAHTLAFEARRAGVTLLPVSVNCSGVHHRAETPRAIRLPLSSVDGVSEDTARDIVFERHARGHYRDLDDFYHRLKLHRDVTEALVLAGAFDDLPVTHPEGTRELNLPRRTQVFATPQRRNLYFRLGVLANASPSGQQALLSPPSDTPPLTPLTEEELLRLDYTTKGLSEDGRHPMDVWRPELRAQGVTPLGMLRPGNQVMTAGLIVAKQRPPTANGVAFFVIEDRQDRAQVVISPELWDANRQLLRDAKALIVEGRVYGEGRAKAVQAFRLAELNVREQVRGYEYG